MSMGMLHLGSSSQMQVRPFVYFLVIHSGKSAKLHLLMDNSILIAAVSLGIVLQGPSGVLFMPWSYGSVYMSGTYQGSSIMLMMHFPLTQTNPSNIMIPMTNSIQRNKPHFFDSLMT